jgi:hypothetical protein
MTEQEIRALVRDAIARKAGPSHLSHPSHHGAVEPSHLRTVASSHLSHPSHQLFTLPIGMDSDGPCIIEPAVQCNHCGYCKSYGH